MNLHLCCFCTVWFFNMNNLNQSPLCFSTYKHKKRTQKTCKVVKNSQTETVARYAHIRSAKNIYRAANICNRFYHLDFESLFDHYSQFLLYYELELSLRYILKDNNIAVLTSNWNLFPFPTQITHKLGTIWHTDSRLHPAMWLVAMPLLQPISTSDICHLHLCPIC